MFKRHAPGTLRANRLISADRPASPLPACKVCGGGVEIFAIRCPHCHAPNPLITVWGVLAVIGAFAIEAGLIVLIVRACAR